MRRIAMAERPDWRSQAESLGFQFHTMDGERYWDERAYYAFSLRQIEHDLEEPTRELHAMALDLVDDVVRSEELLERLDIPSAYWGWIARSWTRRDPHLYGRMDLAYDGEGPTKLYELNYDTPTALYEAAYFQWLWLEQQIAAGALPAQADQYNRIQELLCEALATLAKRGLLGHRLHFSAVRDSVEDRGTVDYLRDCAHQVGIATDFVHIEDIGLTSNGEFADAEDNLIECLFKLYPIEFMLREQFGTLLRDDPLRLIEAVLSNKGVLPLLWERHPGHPNLLPAYFESPHQGVPAGWVRKPLHSREGANIDIVTDAGQHLTSDGPYRNGAAIHQAFHPLPAFDGNYPVIGSWVIADQPAGIGIREDATLITRNSSRFMPHAILS